MKEYYEKIYRELYDISQQYVAEKIYYVDFRTNIYNILYKSDDLPIVLDDYLMGDKIIYKIYLKEMQSLELSYKFSVFDNVLDFFLSIDSINYEKEYMIMIRKSKLKVLLHKNN